jgi:hypothetical protein
MAKRAKESLPAEEIVPVEEQVAESMAVVPLKEPAPEPVSIPPVETAEPGLGQRVRGFFNFLARLLLIVIILGLFGIGLYLVMPLLYQRYVQPVQENTTQLQQLQDQQGQSQQLLADLQDRLSALEAEQARQAESFTNLDQRLSEIETEIAARTESLETLEQMQATLQSQSEERSDELERQLDVLKGMELLSRARLFLYQSNFGLAQQDVQAARDLLRSVQADAPGPLAEDLTSVILRLDLALSNLPDFPVAASDDLDIAWQILLGGTPPAQTLVSVETPTPQITPTPGAHPTGTPTSSVTLTPTATP